MRDTKGSAPKKGYNLWLRDANKCGILRGLVPKMRETKGILILVTPKKVSDYWEKLKKQRENGSAHS